MLIVGVLCLTWSYVFSWRSASKTEYPIHKQERVFSRTIAIQKSQLKSSPATKYNNSYIIWTIVAYSSCAANNLSIHVHPASWCIFVKILQRVRITLLLLSLIFLLFEPSILPWGRKASSPFIITVLLMSCIFHYQYRSYNLVLQNSSPVRQIDQRSARSP